MNSECIKLWYFTWVFLVMRPFCVYHDFLPCDLYHGVLPTFENFNPLITFEQRVIELSYFTWVFLGMSPCLWVPVFFTLWPLSLTYFLKNLTLLITFEQWELKFDFLNEYSLWQDFSEGINNFDPVTLTLEFDLFLITLTLLLIFENWVLELWFFTWVFFFDKTFMRVPTFFYPWPCSLTYFLKALIFSISFQMYAKVLILHMNFACDKIFLLVLNLLTLIFDISFWNIKIMNIRPFTMHMSISYDKTFELVSSYLSLWPWPSLELVIIRGICVSQAHLVFITIVLVYW